MKMFREVNDEELSKKSILYGIGIRHRSPDQGLFFQQIPFTPALRAAGSLSFLWGAKGYVFPHFMCVDKRKTNKLYYIVRWCVPFEDEIIKVEEDRKFIITPIYDNGMQYPNDEIDAMSSPPKIGNFV